MASLPNPTAHSNWVLPGRLAIGGYPDANHLEQLLGRGFNVIACLQTDPELRKLQPYQHLLPPGVLWLQLPITDRLTTTDERVLSFVKLLRYLLEQGKQIYLHCHGGHGRSGTLACVLLSQIEHLNCDEAVTRANAQHRTREYKPDVRIPQSVSQRQQVARLCSPA
jgi:protein-tyrosine phosphatase